MFDAKNLENIFSKSAGGNYKSDITYDTAQVTGSFMLAKLDEYANKLGPNDMFIMYTGSHGSPEGLYLGDEVLPYTAIVDRVLKFKAKEVVIFMMACHSGAFADALTKRHMEYANWGKSGRTLFILGSSLATETSSTFPSDKVARAAQDPIKVPGNTGSTFGHVLWLGLEGGADVNKDKKVTLKEIYDFAVIKTKALGGHTPQFAGDFPKNLVMSLVSATVAESGAGDVTEINTIAAKGDALYAKARRLIDDLTSAGFHLG